MTDARAARSAITRGKLLDAAREEFQRNGFAGGRVDPIAEDAGVNKRMIYVYFGSKAELFNVVLADNVARVAEAVPFTPDDLSEYAVRLFDFWMQDAASLRLFSWRNVELDKVPQFENATYRAMIEQLAARPELAATGLPAAHLLAFVFALVLAWAIPADVFQRVDDDERGARRNSIRTAVTRLTYPATLMPVVASGPRPARS